MSYNVLHFKLVHNVITFLLSKYSIFHFASLEIKESEDQQKQIKTLRIFMYLPNKR